MSSLETDFVCSECIGDPILSKRIAEMKNIQKCKYCKNHNSCIGLFDLTEIVDNVYRENYQLGELYPEYYYPEDSTRWEQSGNCPEILISEMLEVEEEIANDITNILSEQEQHDVIREGADAYYDTTSHYQEIEISDREHVFIWEEFCEKVKHESRFFNESIISLLRDLFFGIQDLKYSEEKQPLRVIGDKEDDKFIYRARKALSAGNRIRICLNPAQELGPPPKKLAKAARMNPSGIPVFYGALERETCLSEIRLIPGEIAISAKFEIIKPLTVLDLTVLKKIYSKLSMFDPFYFNKKSRLEFLRNFESMINIPVLPGDEPLDYIPSQALVEYLSNHFSPRIDAIIYSSIQTNNKGKNIAILNHALKFEKSAKMFRGKDALGQYEESWITDYTIWEKSSTGNIGAGESNLAETRNNNDKGDGVNDKYLQIVNGSLEVHKILGINYKIHTDKIRIFKEDDLEEMPF